MANTSVVYDRVNTPLKEPAEGILAQLGITPSSAIQMLYSQVILHNGLHFEVRHPTPTPTPVAAGVLSRDELDAELARGVRSIEESGSVPAAEAERMLAEELGV